MTQETQVKAPTTKEIADDMLKPRPFNLNNYFTGKPVPPIPETRKYANPKTPGQALPKTFNYVKDSEVYRSPPNSPARAGALNAFSIRSRHGFTAETA